VDPPSESVIRDWYAGAFLLDSYRVTVVDDGAAMRVIAERALGSPPGWFKALMAIRDGVMGPLGVRTSADLRHVWSDRQRIDFFPVLAESADELVLGEDDNHLDFRLSLFAVWRGGSGTLEAPASSHERVSKTPGWRRRTDWRIMGRSVKTLDGSTHLARANLSEDYVGMASTPHPSAMIET
jgi:hypothetical protein